MKKYLIFILLLLSVAAIAFIGCGRIRSVSEDGYPRPGASLAKGPYLLYVNNNTSMTVLWQADQTPDISVIEWGSSTSYGSSAEVTENSSAESMHQFSYTITGLSPGTKTYYKVRVDYDDYESYFYAAPVASTTALTFYAYGDTRNPLDFIGLPPEQHDWVLTAILNDLESAPTERQTFIAHSGDITMFGLTEECWGYDYFSREYPNMVKFFSMYPAMLAIGNHEAYHLLDLTFTIDHINAGKLLRKYYPYSNLVESERNYYSFDYGPVHFTILDQYTLLDGVTGQGYTWEAETDTGQFAWMKNDLQNTTKPWKVVMFHEPAWTAKKGYGFSKNNRTMQQYYCPIFKQYGVKVAVQGHVHYYSRCATEEIQYLTLGGGGAELTDLVETDAPAFVTGEAFVYHFARFDIVDNNTMNVFVINKDGGTIDSFTVTQ